MDDHHTPLARLIPSLALAVLAAPGLAFERVLLAPADDPSAGGGGGGGGGAPPPETGSAEWFAHELATARVRAQQAEERVKSAEETARSATLRHALDNLGHEVLRQLERAGASEASARDGWALLLDGVKVGANGAIESITLDGKSHATTAEAIAALAKRSPHLFGAPARSGHAGQGRAAPDLSWKELSAAEQFELALSTPIARPIEPDDDRAPAPKPKPAGDESWKNKSFAELMAMPVKK